ncbi:hypothetical protein [Frigoribacterium sp. PhB116]|uniref:hypothetical protein n=1 Tax=Frigoribacterium sp. PhB116 TaxID=2485174 RepID=UPI00105C9EF5|nr:hypothetical protein [Frigoribacterium sp. PhB116]TDT61448.1 hypothetical protein EDF20_3104 [Frigoribacterium sp. PhB116]
MTTSHRLRTSAGAAALTAALVLVPTAAFADDAPTAATSTTAAPDAASAAAPAAAPSDAPAPADPADAASSTPAPTTTPGNTAVGRRPAPTTDPAPAPTAAAEPAAATATDASVPTAQGAGTVVVVAPEVEPSVGVYPGAAHPGSTFSVFVEGFTAGDAVSARVDGDAVSPDDVFSLYPDQLPFVFDASGSVYFDVEVPTDLPLGTLTVTVSDAHGTTSSTEVAVTDPIPAPVVVAPVGAAAGIVTVTGSGGLPGQAVVVVVGAPDDVDEGFGFAFGSGGSSSDAPVDAPAEEAAADLTSLVTTAEQAEAAPDEDFFDHEPVQYSATDGPASALVPIAADGTFSARFVLPAGDFGTTAVVIDTETSDTSLAAAVAPFTVSAAAAAPVVTPAGPAGVPVNTVVATRGGSLAYTGTESALPAGIAALALLLGGVLTTAARLRRRA